MAHDRRPRALHILVAPDSFKGSLSAHAVAGHITAGLLKALPDCVVTQAPIADGGEGTAEIVAGQLGGSWHAAEVLDANGAATTFPFAVCSSPTLAGFAIFDVAGIVGLPDAVAAPGVRTTRGVGQAVRAIAQQGYRTIVVALGGSSTNDGGAGMLSELAVTFHDSARQTFHPTLDTLPGICALQPREDCAWLADITLIGLTDVTSPLTGPDGASHTFGAQKGVTDLAGADRRLAAFAAKLSALQERDWSGEAGAGAAGGLGYAVRALGGCLQPGAAFILDALGLDGATMAFDWVITGEGRSDVQTLLGKGPAIVAALAREHGIPVTLLSGAIECDAALFAAFDGCVSVQAAPVPLAWAMAHGGALLEDAANNLARLFVAASRSACVAPR